jgi:hypothetical protein
MVTRVHSMPVAIECGGPGTGVGMPMGFPGEDPILVTHRQCNETGAPVPWQIAVAAMLENDDGCPGCGGARSEY